MGDLAAEIGTAQRLVKTDAYQMSIGEIVSMYENGELVIDPEFQRLFRWKREQKSRLIESILLGIPLPSIFVFERHDGTWELIDGLQRLSTVLEFMGKLREPDGDSAAPSILEGTKYLPSLHNAVWEKSELIVDVPVTDQFELSKAHQLSIRRARIGVEILKRPSDDQTKFDLFQGLNAGGTQANAQELRNCIILMVNGAYYRAVKTAAEHEVFQTVTGLSEEQIERQRHMEYAVRFLVHTEVPYDGTLDVEEYIDEGVVKLAAVNDGSAAQILIDRTFGLLNAAAGKNALRRFENGHHVGKVSLGGLEAIAVGVAKNLAAILNLPDPQAFVKNRIEDFWKQPEIASSPHLGYGGRHVSRGPFLLGRFGFAHEQAIHGFGVFRSNYRRSSVALAGNLGFEDSHQQGRRQPCAVCC